MKTYILRKPKPVEPQKSSCPPRPKPAAPVVAKGPILFIGLDVHNDSIAVSLAPSDATKVPRKPGERLKQSLRSSVAKPLIRTPGFLPVH